VIRFDEKAIDTLFRQVDQCHLPGAAVGIALHGRPLYRKAFGLAHMELPVLLTTSMRMRIYSTSKQFTSLAYLLLCEEGRAGIDDKIEKYLPELHPATHGVTVRQLLGNVGGLRDAHDLTWQFSGTGRLLSSADLLSFYRDVDDVNFAPGSAWSYQNGGFLLTSFAIERITGKPLEDVLRERIFAPLGMNDTLLRRTDNDFVPNSATMHMIDNAGRFDRSYVGTALAGEAGLVSTVDDVLRWMAHMDAPIVGNVATWALMKTPFMLPNGCSTGYGLGLMSGEYRGARILHHAGGGQGANSQMLKVPDAGLDVVVLVNRHDVSAAALTLQILDSCLTGLEPCGSVVDARSYTGVFQSPTTGRVIQLSTSAQDLPWIRQDDPIVVMDGFDIPVARASDGVLRPVPLMSYMNISVAPGDASKEPGSIVFDDFGTTDRMIRVPPVAQPDIERICGRYRSKSTGTELTISQSETGPRMHSEGRFGSADFTLECLGDSIWRARSTTPMSWGGILTFDAGQGSFQYTSLRTRALPFRRAA
jgi:CubicO group peptidase (beta-lactamase class C family)